MGKVSKMPVVTIGTAVRNRLLMIPKASGIARHKMIRIETPEKTNIVPIGSREPVLDGIRKLPNAIKMTDAFHKPCNNIARAYILINFKTLLPDALERKAAIPQPVRLAVIMCIIVLPPRTSSVAAQLESGVAEASKLSTRPKAAPLNAPITNP